MDDYALAPPCVYERATSSFRINTKVRLTSDAIFIQAIDL